MMRKILSTFSAAILALTLSAPAFAAPASYVNSPMSTPQELVNSAITNVNTNLAPTGAGTVAAAIDIPSVTSAVNQIKITPAATGTAPSISAGGASADTNVGLSVAGNGTGIVRLGQTICTVTGATPQTCNGQRGIVTTGTLTTAAVTNAAYVINNSSVTSTSLIACTLQAYSGTLVTNGLPVAMTCVPGSGTITVNITNIHSVNALNGTVQIGFTVLN